jgi:hypothetical protein
MYHLYLQMINPKSKPPNNALVWSLNVESPDLKKPLTGVFPANGSIVQQLTVYLFMLVLIT